MRKQWLILLMVMVASVALWGCGSSGSGGSEVTAPAEIRDAANAGNCTVCHTFEVHAEIDGIAGVNPDTDGLGSAITHDCEACHGGGQFHHGEGPLPFPDPNGERCAECHDQATLFLSSAHNLLDEENVEMLADGHDTSYCQRCHTAEGSRAFIDVIGEKDDISAAIVAYGDDVIAPAMYEAFENEDADGNALLHVATCGACHNPLTKELVTAELPASWDPNQNGEADQLDLCTSCHNYKTADGSMIFGSGSVTSGTAEWYHDTAWYRTIASTHYDDPATLSGQGNEVGGIINKIEGYVIRENSENPCFDCHGHELKTNTRRANDLDGSDESRTPTVHNGWARSGHGGKLLDNIFAAVDLIDCTGSSSLSHGRCDEQADAAMAAYTSDTTGGVAWSHYDWDDTSSRGSCQECHTATGAMNYLNDPENYDSANNDFSHLSGWVDGVSSSPQNEMLYCWGCHSNAEAGTLRNPGATTRPYTVGAVDVTMPDVGNSNVCINCHGARGNVEGYALAGDPATDMAALKPGFGPGTKNVTNAHYLVASATLYAADTKIGYEYLGQDYAPVSFFAHDAIGLNADSPETGAGPCVACHMETDDTHTFEVVDKDDMGVITALNSTSCIECHTGGHGAGLVVADTTTENGLQTAAAAAAFLEEEAEGYHEALEILNVALVAKGLVFAPNYPYFSGLSWINEGTFGAAHNYNYLHHEPGAYAHNRYYAKRLIFDSLDWLDNGVLDGAIMIDAAMYPEADAWLASGIERP